MAHQRDATRRTGLLLLAALFLLYARPALDVSSSTGGVAGLDLDHDGIRDDVDRLIARDFRESLSQTRWAREQARLFQQIATTPHYTFAEADQLSHRLLWPSACLLWLSTESQRYPMMQKLRALEDATFNTPERRHNEDAMDSVLVNYIITAPDFHTCPTRERLLPP